MEWSTLSSDLNTGMLIILGVINIVNVVLTKKAATNIAIVEKATNSMKDALVAATAKASLAEGKAAGMEKGKAEGLEQGRNEKGN